MTETAYKSPARVDDLSTGKKRYFDSVEKANAFVAKATAKAIANGEQTQDRWYMWNNGVQSSFNL
jgi:hypothetical protein